MTGPPVVIVSNRGPVAFDLEGGRAVATRGAGGLVAGLGPIAERTGALWVAATMNDAEREVAAGGVTRAAGHRLELVAIERATFRAHYDVICNATLWYAHHGLWDLARRPRFDRSWWQAWDAYLEVNERMAEAVAAAAPDGAVVLVQDYHLTLVGQHLARSRPDVAAVHFAHTPFATPDGLAVLPPVPRRRLLEGLAAHRACGFHVGRWSDRFRANLEAEALPAPEVFVSALASDPEALRAAATTPEADAARARLDDLVGDRAVIGRVDRIELSKNVLRGFLAYELLLDERPEWRDRVVFAASVYPSREGLADYVAYRQEIEGLVGRINERFGTATWTPVVLDTDDELATSLAVLARYDVLLVNPVVDGLNLVAREGPLLNRRDGVLCLSPGAGAHDDLADLITPVHPYDLVGTADALDASLRLPAEDRARRAAALLTRVEARTPDHWWADNVAAGTGRTELSPGRGSPAPR